MGNNHLPRTGYIPVIVASAKQRSNRSEVLMEL